MPGTTTRDAPWSTQLWNLVPDGLVLSCRGVVVAANASAEQMFGYRQSALVDVPHHQIFPTRFEGRRQDGSLFPMQLSVSPLEPPGGGELAIVRDMTDIVRWKVAASQADDELDRASQTRQWIEARHESTRETTTQQLFAVGLALQLCLRDLEDAPSRVQLERAIDVIDRLIADLSTAPQTPPVGRS